MPMQNPTLELMHQHASVRHYKPDPVPTSMIEAIVAAAQCASTSSNLQAYSVVAVSDPAKREKLSALCGDQTFIREAPIFLAWCADLARLDHICNKQGYSQVTGYVENFLVPVIDAALAAQNAALAAESLGLGICFIGYIRNIPEEIINLLELPKLTFPITGMSVGWQSKPSHKRPRLPQNAILHWEKYNCDQETALQEYDQAMRLSGIYKGRQISTPGKPAEIIDYGWLEHTARRVSIAERTDLRKTLEKQGFGFE
jgi:nitroreductase